MIITSIRLHTTRLECFQIEPGYFLLQDERCKSSKSRSLTRPLKIMSIPVRRVVFLNTYLGFITTQSCSQQLYSCSTNSAGEGTERGTQQLLTGNNLNQEALSALNCVSFLDYKAFSRLYTGGAVMCGVSDSWSSLLCY